jgi:hypothetical protein
MAAVAWERSASRKIIDEESPSAETVWIVTGASSYANARTALDAALPTSFTFPSSRVAYLNNIEAIEQRDDEFYEFLIRYESQAKPTFGDIEYELDVSAPTGRVYQSLATVGYVASGTAPDFGGAIGVRPNGPPTGAELPTPFSTFSLTKHWAVASITDAYQTTLHNLVGTVNNATFYGRAAGTVKLLGISGRQNGDKFPITYEFGFRPNQGSQTINGITVTSVPGWEIMDILSEAQTDQEKLVWPPVAVYVHRCHVLDGWTGLAL